MGELMIRRNRGFSVPRYEKTGKAEKQAGSSQSQRASGKTGLAVSETLRQLMSRVNQAENRSREGRRALQTGEAVLSEVQEKLGRLAELAGQAAGDGAPDRAALQAELEQLREAISRMLGSATAGDVQLFLDDGLDVEAGEDAAPVPAEEEAPAGQEDAVLPDWLTKSILRDAPDAERLLAALGLDQNATGAELLAALANSSLESSDAAGYLASLYLGAVIAGGSLFDTIDPMEALEGLQQLLDQVAQGMPPDQAIEMLTNGLFTSFADFESQIAGGTAPGLQDFLTGLLLSGGGDLLPEDSMLTLLAGAGGMELDMMMSLLSALQDAGAASPAEASAQDAARAPFSVLQYGGVQVMGRDLSGVSFDSASGELTIGGTQDIVLQGTGQDGQAVRLTGSGTVTIQNMDISMLTVDTGAARLVTVGGNSLGETWLHNGASLTLDGGGLLYTGGFHAGEGSSLRLSGGAVVVLAADGETPGTLALPVVMDGPASLAAQAGNVRGFDGTPLSPFDIVWKTLLPDWVNVSAMAVDGKRVKLSLWGGEQPVPARLWLAKGDASHGYPAHTAVLWGRDQTGRIRTRYAYLRWSGAAGAFEESVMYPNPFTVTGGEQGRDWEYEEETQTLRILSDQVTGISGGAGTDANQMPFGSRIALADHIGGISLALGGVICQVAAGRAFSLGRENDVTLLLQRGTDNRFESGAGCAGISLGDGTQLRIDNAGASGSQKPVGTLTAAGNGGGAGIGRDSGGSCDRVSHILICGGGITATGTGGGAGIGAGRHGAMGAVTISGGVVSATGGKGGGAGIGGALGAPVGDISIHGGVVTAVALYHAAAIGAGVEGECGDIRITGASRIVKAVGGDPGADIGACLFGGCGRVDVSGSADIGGAGLRTKSGLPLHTGEGAVTLPQFRLSAKALQLDKLDVSTREYAQAALAALEADRRWVARIQTAYGTLYNRLEQSNTSLRNVQRYIDVAETLVRDTGTAGSLLGDMRRAILRESSQAMQTHGRRSAEDVQQLLR